MASITIHQIIEQLEKLPAEKLPVVYDFVSFLTQRGSKESEISTDILQTMLASENVLKQDWDRPEEDEAWADL